MNVENLFGESLVRAREEGIGGVGWSVPSCDTTLVGGLVVWGEFGKFAAVMNQDLDIGMLLRYVLTSHELWGSSCEGICALLLAWVFALRAGF